MISSLFNILLYRPLMNALIFLYQIIPGNDFGIAIILLTVFIRFVLYPINSKGIKAQKIINEIQPKVKEIQEKYKDDKEKQVGEILRVYKEAKTSPFSGFLPLLIQLPVLIALYRVLWGVQSSEAIKALYSFVPHPGEISSLFLGVINLANSGTVEVDGQTVFLLGNMIIIVGAGIAQFFQMKMVMAQRTNKKEKKKQPQEMAERMQKQMAYFFPFFTIIILLRLPSAIALYWLTGALFSIIQQHFILKKT